MSEFPVKQYRIILTIFAYDKEKFLSFQGLQKFESTPQFGHNGVHLEGLAIPCPSYALLFVISDVNIQRKETLNNGHTALKIVATSVIITNSNITSRIKIIIQVLH